MVHCEIHGYPLTAEAFLFLSLLSPWRSLPPFVSPPPLFLRCQPFPVHAPTHTHAYSALFAPLFCRESAQKVIFSQPYLNTGLRILVHKVPPADSGTRSTQFWQW